MPLSKPDTSGGFHPRVHVGEDIARPAFEVLRLDGILETRLLSPQLHQIVLGMARLRNAVSSLRLEGEQVEFDHAREVLEGRKPTSPAEVGFFKLARAYKDLALHPPPRLTRDLIVAKHRELFQGVLADEVAGHLKTRQNSIIHETTGQVRFLPTPPARLDAEIQALLEWYDAHRFDYPPAVISALFFAEFQSIHPFIDGNGRLGRYLNMMILKQLGCSQVGVVPLDLRFFRSSEKYYELLGSTNTGTDYTLWCRYFVGEVKHAYRVAVKQADLVPIITRFRRESTRVVLRWILSGDGSWFGRGDYPNPRHYSVQALWGALNELRRAGVLESRGERRGRTYRLNSRFLADLYARKLLSGS